MTTKITVSVNGNYKIPVKQGETTVWVTGRYPEGEAYAGPRGMDFHPNHGDGGVFVIGPEVPDNGDA